MTCLCYPLASKPARPSIPCGIVVSTCIYCATSQAAVSSISSCILTDSVLGANLVHLSTFRPLFFRHAKMSPPNPFPSHQYSENMIVAQSRCFVAGFTIDPGTGSGRGCTLFREVLWARRTTRYLPKSCPSPIRPDVVDILFWCTSLMHSLLATVEFRSLPKLAWCLINCGYLAGRYGPIRLWR